jgi:membrane-associated phospholipid phosphatase
MKQFIYCFCLIATFYSCKPKTDTHDTITNNPIVFCTLVKELNDGVLGNNFPPMIAARIYAYSNIAAYECIAGGNKNYTSLANQLKGLNALPVPRDTAIDFNLAAMLSFLKAGNTYTFPEGRMMEAYEQIKDSVIDAGISKKILSATIAYSDTVVASIIAWSKKDNYAQTRSAEKYTVTNAEGKWIPTPPAYASAVEYKWATIRTLAIDSASQFKPIPPPAYNVTDKNSVFYKAALEVKKIGDSLTKEQTHIANFFDDNPFKLIKVGHVEIATKKFSPPGHWLNIVGIAAQKSKVDFATTVCAYVKTSIALFDAFISCWDGKYRSNLVRPETVINKYIDPNWRPFIQTPPFPSYTSGHSVSSAAAAEVLTSMFGENFSYKDSSEREFGIPDRTFTSFKAAANEASISRLYGGIHYSFDLTEGTKQGEALGKFIVNTLKMKCFIPCLGG